MQTEISTRCACLVVNYTNYIVGKLWDKITNERMATAQFLMDVTVTRGKYKQSVSLSFDEFVS